MQPVKTVPPDYLQKLYESGQVQKVYDTGNMQYSLIPGGEKISYGEATFPFFYTLIGIMILIGIILLIIGVIVAAVDKPNVPVYAWVLIGIGAALIIISIISILIRYLIRGNLGGL